MRSAVLLFLMAIWLGLSVSGVRAADGPIERGISFVSWSPGSYAEVAAGPGRAPAASIEADLVLPAGTSHRSPVPAVVLLHGSSGFSNGYGLRVARALARRGLAALVVHTYRSRGIERRPTVPELAEKVPRYSQIADAYAALDYLSDLPEIDPRRIVLGGFSTGGKVAVLAAFEPVAAAVTDSERRFAGHVSYWGICDTLYEDFPATGAPVLLMIGEKDEVTPRDRCKEVAENLTELGAPTRLRVYSGAHHAWNGVDFEPKFLAKRYNPANCRWILSGDGTARELTTGVSGGWDDPGLARGFLCLTRGYTVGRNDAVTAESRRDVVAFIASLPPSPQR